MSDEVPQYRLLGPVFFEPDLVPAGSIVNWDGPPNSSMEPMNEAAEERMAQYYKEKPHAGIKAGDNLPLTMKVVTPPAAEEEPVLDLASAQLQRVVTVDGGPTPKKKSGA